MKAVQKLESTTRKSWLAGLGALHTGREMVTDKLDSLYVEGNAFVQDLLQRGHTLQSDMQVNQKANEMIDEKIAALRAKLGMQSKSTEAQLDRLSAKVDDLIDVVAKLAAKKAAEKAAAEKATVSKATSAKSAESAKPAPAKAKKAPAKRSTAATAKPRTKKAATPKTTDK